MADTNGYIDEQVSILFANAIVKLEKVKQEEKDKRDYIKYEVPKKKKEIVIELAKSLEEKGFPKDTISIKITCRLPPLVSERFIRKCIDEKYKQKHRVENAKKQKKHQPKAEGKEESKLAAKIPLKQEEEKQENKEVIAVDHTGRSVSSAQKENDESFTTTSEGSNILEKKDNDQSFYLSQKEQELSLEKPRQLTAIVINADEVLIKETASEAAGTSFKPPYDNNKDILYVEFPVNRKDLQNYLGTEANDDKIWFICKINTDTKEIFHSFGRINQQQQIDEGIGIANGDYNR